MQDDGVVGQLVEVRDGGQEDRGRGGDGDELARADGREDGEEGVSIVADGLNLRRTMSAIGSCN